MKLKKFLLKNIDDESADIISECYPADWDMDKVFNSSYKKFLMAKKAETENAGSIDYSDEELQFCPVENIPKKRRISISALSGLAAAAFVIMIPIMFRSLCIMPGKVDESPEDIDNNHPIFTYENSYTSEQNTYDSSNNIFEKTQPVSGEAPSENSSTEISTSDDNFDVIPSQNNTVTDVSANDATDSPLPTVQTEIQATSDIPASTTASSVATSQTTQMTTAVSSQKTTITTPPPIDTQPRPNEEDDINSFPKTILTRQEFIDILTKKSTFTWADFSKYKSRNIGSGIYLLEYEFSDSSGIYLYITGKDMNEIPDRIYLSNKEDREIDIYIFKEAFLDSSHFEYIEAEPGSNTWHMLKYVKSSNIDITKKNHTPKLDGFDINITRENEYNTNITINNLTDNQTYLMSICPYEYFQMSLNPKFEWIRSYEPINGLPGCMVTNADENNEICTLYWDDRCHVCSLTSSVKNYDTMLFIAENILQEE